MPLPWCAHSYILSFRIGRGGSIRAICLCLCLWWHYSYVHIIRWWYRMPGALLLPLKSPVISLCRHASRCRLWVPLLLYCHWLARPDGWLARCSVPSLIGLPCAIHVASLVGHVALARRCNILSFPLWFLNAAVSLQIINRHLCSVCPPLLNAPSCYSGEAVVAIYLKFVCVAALHRVQQTLVIIKGARYIIRPFDHFLARSR